MAYPKDFDIVHITYDEPNAEENFFHIEGMFPNAKRVDKVKGLDAAHRAAANLSNTEFTLIIDGDNKLMPSFLDVEINEFSEDHVVSWAAQNVINGLIYGNGGVKLWPTRLLSAASCHDNADSAYCDWFYKYPYKNVNEWHSISYCNSSPFQAFRTGFREGVRLCLDLSGNRALLPNGKINRLSEQNRMRLLAWTSVGADTLNGYYAMFGARLGLLKTICEPTFEINKISDYDWIASYWQSEFSYVRDGHSRDHFEKMGRDIKRLTGLPVANFNSDQSECAKQLLINHARPNILKGQGAHQDQNHKNVLF